MIINIQDLKRQFQQCPRGLTAKDFKDLLEFIEMLNNKAEISATYLGIFDNLPTGDIQIGSLCFIIPENNLYIYVSNGWKKTIDLSDYYNKYEVDKKIKSIDNKIDISAMFAQEAGNRALEYSNNPPIIKNNTWWFYHLDSKIYYDSGISAKGISAYEDWLAIEGNENKTLEDFYNYLREPAITAQFEVKEYLKVVDTNIKNISDNAILATNNANSAATKANSVSDNPGYIGDDYHVYTWNYATQSYTKTDRILKPESFNIYRVYASITAMNADLANVPEGKFVIINTGSVEDADTAKLYVRGATAFEYLVDMSGAIGFTGKTAQFSIGTVATGAAGSNVSVSLSSDGVDVDGNPKYKINFSIPQGDTGNSGVHTGSNPPAGNENLWIDPSQEVVDFDQLVTDCQQATADSKTQMVQISQNVSNAITNLAQTRNYTGISAFTPEIAGNNIEWWYRNSSNKLIHEIADNPTNLKTLLCARAFNYALSESEVKTLYNGGRVDKYKLPNYMKKQSSFLPEQYLTTFTGYNNFDGEYYQYVRTEATGSPKANIGEIIKGNTYIIILDLREVDSYRFSIYLFQNGNLPSTKIANNVYRVIATTSGAIYLANGGNECAYGIKSAQIINAGCIAEYLPESLTPTTWYDTSGQGNNIALGAGAELIEDAPYQEVLDGAGAPSVIPDILGQTYIDTTNKKVYKSCGVTATSDWVITN